MSDEFPFVKGDIVQVKVREHGTKGNIIAKFRAKCTDIRAPIGDGFASPRATLRLPFGARNSVILKPHEAEFEVVEP